jgi:hypothetical protein
MAPHGIADESGVMLVDALIGTLITALFIGIALTALSLSRTSVSVARERGRALAELQALIAATPAWPHTETGTSNGFKAAVTVTEEHYGHALLCHIDARVTEPRTKRHYGLSAARWCVQREAQPS